LVRGFKRFSNNYLLYRLGRANWTNHLDFASIISTHRPFIASTNIDFTCSLAFSQRQETEVARRSNRSLPPFCVLLTKLPQTAATDAHGLQGLGGNN
jgi:hypothetical protein